MIMTAMMMMTKREGADEEEATGAGGVLRASGLNADTTEEKDGKDGDEIGETGDGGFASWWFAARLRCGCWWYGEQKDGKDDDGDGEAGDAGGVCYAPSARMLMV
jgi:hypothetical protein